MTQRVSVTGVKRSPGLSVQNEGSVLFGSGQLKNSVRRLPAPAARGVHGARDMDAAPVPDVEVMPMDRSAGSCRSQARCREPYGCDSGTARESPTPRPAYARERFRHFGSGNERFLQRHKTKFASFTQSKSEICQKFPAFRLC